MRRNPAKRASPAARSYVLSYYAPPAASVHRESGPVSRCSRGSRSLTGENRPDRAITGRHEVKPVGFEVFARRRIRTGEGGIRVKIGHSRVCRGERSISLVHGGSFGVLELEIVAARENAEKVDTRPRPYRKHAFDDKVHPRHDRATLGIRKIVRPQHNDDVVGLQDAQALGLQRPKRGFRPGAADSDIGDCLSRENLLEKRIWPACGDGIAGNDDVDFSLNERKLVSVLLDRVGVLIGCRRCRHEHVGVGAGWRSLGRTGGGRRQQSGNQRKT